MKQGMFLAVAVLTAMCVSVSTAEEEIAEEKITTVLDGLKNPCGVAVQPGTGHVFVSDSAAGRIVRVVDGEAEDVITGSALGVYGKGPKYDIGPLGIVFLDKDRLLVGDGGYEDGQEFLRVFSVPESGQPALGYDDGTKIGPLVETDELKAEGNLYGVAATSAAIFATCNGDDTKGWVARSAVNGTKFEPLERFIATKEAVQVDAPVGITISPRGEVVIGQMGEINVANDSQLSMYNAIDGKLLANWETGLYDISAVAYSPQGHLYALDFAWMATGEGGLFRLDKDEDGVKAVKICPLDKPTSMAFSAQDGALYITVIGELEEGSQVGSGKLLRLEPGL